MRAGELKYKLVLLQPTIIVDAFGAESTIYKEIRTVAAERVKINGSKRIEVGEQFPDYRVDFNIRDAHPVKENWKVRQLGGYEYTVNNIIPNRQCGMLTLICERVNK